MKIRDDDVREIRAVPCPRCAETVLVALIERGPTHNVYACLGCKTGFAKVKT